MAAPGTPCRPTSGRSSATPSTRPASGSAPTSRALNETVQADLQSKGLAFNKTNPESFRAKLREAGFYKDWQARFGEEAWGLLEGAVGKLA
jgi:hypothetical protein